MAWSFVQPKRVEMGDEHLRKVWRIFFQIGDGVMGKILSRYVGH